MAHGAGTRQGGRTLALLAAAVVASLALFLAIGHASHASMGMGSDAVMHGVYICVPVATLISTPLLPAALPAFRVRLPRSLPAPSFAPVPAPIAFAAARASPAWLQRFRD